jgi:hypothetical protein
MGCANSPQYYIDANKSNKHNSVLREDATLSETTLNINEVEIDFSHFSTNQKVLGLGGFGMVRSVKKMTGKDNGVEYAMKSMSKQDILRRLSGSI